MSEELILNEDKIIVIAARVDLQPVASNGTRPLSIGGGDLGILSGPIEILYPILEQLQTEFIAAWEKAAKALEDAHTEAVEAKKSIIIAD